MFVPEDFRVPVGLTDGTFRLEPLSPAHSEMDLAAWSGSVEHIRTTPGFAGRSWPPLEGMPPAQNTADLLRHERDFAVRRGFTYTVLRTLDGVVIGCVYIYPADDAEHDAQVRSWVRAENADLDEPLYRLVRAWLARDWPFRAPAYAAR
jgi:hypothetical protein